MHFCIVIPTLNRCEYLKYSVVSCLNQDVDELTVVVCDNNSEDDTEKYIRSLNDQRIKYVKPPRRMSMSLNWDFALNHIEGDVVSFIGDDDVLLPGALKNVAMMFQKEQSVSVIRQTPVTYYYPECMHKDKGKLFSSPITGEYNIRNSRDELKKVAKMNYWYGHLPVLYHGFVLTEYIMKIKKKTGSPFFRKAAPDIYSDCLLAYEGCKYVYLDYPLTVGGQGAKANGVNFTNKTEIGTQFEADSRKELFHKYPIKIIVSHLLDCIEDVSVIMNDRELTSWIDYENAVIYVIKEMIDLGISIDDVEMMEFFKKISTKTYEELYNIYQIQFSNCHKINVVKKEKEYLEIKPLIRKIMNKLNYKKKMTTVFPPLKFNEDLTLSGIKDALGAAQYVADKIKGIRIKRTS